MENYSMYRFYKGEKTNPFENEYDTSSALFWDAEYTFDSSYFKKKTSDLYSFFKDHDMSDRFMKLLSEDDHDYLTEKSKKPVFELWLEYLFKYKYYGEYGGENKLKKIYYSTDLLRIT
jgi:hypothetical protein